MRLDVVNFARRKGLMTEFTNIADACMAEYDLDGWTDPTWSFEG